MKQTTEQSIQVAKTAEWFNEAMLAAADYSSKVATRQLAFARKFAAQNGDFSWQKLMAAPDATEVKQSASEYLTFARDSVEDFAQASDRNFALLERAVDGAATATDGQALPPQAEAFGRQWVDGVKAANAAVKDGIRASCQVATDGLHSAKNGEEVVAAKSANGKAGKK